MMLQNYVISGGLLGVGKIGEKLIVALSITLLQKYLKDLNMIKQSICGVWES